MKFYILFFIPIFSFAQKGEPSVLNDGLAKMDKGDYPAAISQFAKVLEQYPDNYPSNLGMGISLRETGHPDSAMKYFDQAIKIQPTAEAYLNRAALFYSLKVTSKGEKDEQAALRLQQPSANIYGLRGFCLLQRREYARAIPLFDTAISIDRTICKTYLNKAAALANLKRYQEAIEVLNRVIELKPDYYNAYFNRARVCAETGDPDQAMADCEKLIELAPANTEGLLLRASIKDQIGDDPGALEDCNKAIAIDPNNAKAYNMRAVTRFDAQENEAIITDCDKAIAIDPNYYDPYVQRGDAYDNLGEYDKAIADYTKAISIDPSKILAFRECAASVANKKDYKGSLEYVNKGLRLEPENLYLLEHKFQLQRLTGDLMGAIATLDQCIKYRPDSAMYFNLHKAYVYDSLRNYASACKFAFEALKENLGDGYDYLMAHPCDAYKKQPLVLAQPFIREARVDFENEMYNAEIVALTKAIALLPDSAALYYNRGMGKRKLNNFLAAIQDYNKAIGLRPKFPDAITSRSVAEQYLGDIDAAKRDCLLAIKVDSTAFMAYNNYAIMIAETDINGAIGYLTKAIYLNKKYTSAYLTRGKLYEKLDKKQEACADLKKAAALGSDDARIECMVNCK